MDVLWKVSCLRLLLIFGLVGVATAAAVPKRDLSYFYRTNCAACHGVDGSARAAGGGRLSGRALSDRVWLAKQKEEDLVQSVQNGKGAMPSYKEKLTIEETRRLLKEIVLPLAKTRGRTR